MLGKYKESLAERDLLEQMSTEQEFENLKSQVNPHFLFNCFNTLSSLIQEDKREAEKFLDELSKVYRYLLRSNEDGVSTVEKEVKFLESYYRLLKTRYGDGLHINIDIDKRYYPYLVPSLSLQLLVENAVKHNVIANDSVIRIGIRKENDYIVVENNMNVKQNNGNEKGMGIENIKSRYSILSDAPVIIKNDGLVFSVAVPVLKMQGK